MEINWEMAKKFRINKQQLSILNNIPKFYWDLTTMQVADKNSKNVVNGLDQNWGNNKNVYKRKCLFYRNWMEVGIVHMKHLMENGRWMKTEDVKDKLRYKRIEYCSKHSVMQVQGCFLTHMRKHAEKGLLYKTLFNTLLVIKIEANLADFCGKSVETCLQSYINLG